MRPAVISFYSYKGGVGRTLLAANMAVALAREGKTLLWDMDVEAPGLHHIQALRNQGAIQTGFFDWLLDWQKNKLRPPGAQDLGQFGKLVQPTPFSQLFILPAHGDDADAATLYFGIDWAYLLGGEQPPGRDLFAALFEQLGREGFRHVLIDTRTGLTDLGGLLAGALPDATVLVGGYGTQNLRGLGKVYQALSRLDRSIRPSNTDLRLFPVASPIPQDDADKVAAGKKLWSQALGIPDVASVREIRYDPALPFSEALLITQPERKVAADYERVYRDLSQFIGTLFEAEAAEQAQRERRPDLFERDPSHSRAAQGKRFEDRVADLLRLLGYTVEREQLIGPDRVDLIARIESGLDTLTYFVECKDHRQAVSKEVVDLLGLWLRKPAAQAMHARGMVVANAFSPAALASAKDLGITTATLPDLERRLLNFDGYLHTLVADFEQTSLATSYVTQQAAEAAIPDLVAHGIEWANGRDSRLWVLLGDYGTGKTAFTEKLSHELAKRAREDGQAPVPLRVSLRDFPNKVRLEELLAERWLQATGQRKDPRVLLHLVQRGRIVLIFDAFDEMGIATAGRSVVEQFRMLVGITANAGDTPQGNRVLITCREQFFKDHGDAIKAAAGEQDRIPTSPLQDVAQRFDGAIHTVATFTPEQVRQFLVLRLGEAKGNEALTFLREQRMLELGDRPQLLDIIIASLPSLKERQARSGEPLSTGVLYQAYTNKWLEEFKPIERQSTSATLRTVLEELALLLWQRVGNRIHYGDLFGLVKQRVDWRGQLDPNQLDVELRTAAFLSRTPDGLYGFSHRSFLEFFLARRIERAACVAADSQALSPTLSQVLDVPRLSPEVCRFVHDLVPPADTTRRTALRQAVRALLRPAPENTTDAAPAASRVNALLLAHRLASLEAGGLHAAMQAMPSWIPDRAHLAGLDLSELRMPGLVAPKADLRGSKLTRCDLSGARLAGAQLQQADMRWVRLVETDLSGADLSGANASDCTASQVNLNGAQAQGSFWLNADLQQAELADTDFAHADLRAARLARCIGQPRLADARTQGLTARDARGWAADWQALCQPVPDRLVLAPEAGHVGGIHALAWSPDGRQLASAGADGTVRLWDAAGGQALRVLQGHEGWVKSVAWSPDGGQLASAGLDGTVRLWDAAGGQALRVLQGHEGSVQGVAWSPDGGQLAGVCDDGTVRLWDAVGGQALRVLPWHVGWVEDVAWSPDGGQLAGVCDDGTVRLWDASGGQALRVLQGHEGSVRSVAWSPDGGQLASAGDDGTVRLWDAAGGQALRVLQGHEDSVRSVAWSPDGGQLASASHDGTVRLWDAAGGQALWVLPGHVGWVKSVVWSPDGGQLISAGLDGTVRLWDAAGGQALRTLPGHKIWLQSVAWSPDGGQLASASDDGTVRLWDAAGGQALRVLPGHEGWVLSVAWSPDGRQLAGVCDDGTVRLWDAAGGQALRVLQGHEGWVRSVAWSPDGGKLASAGADGTVRLWDAAGGQALRVLQGHEGWVRSVAWSPDGGQLASASHDGTVRLWDAAGGQALRVLKGHEVLVLSVAWSPDGRQLAGVCDDGKVRLWDAAGGQALRVLQGHKGGLQSVAWSPDGGQLAGVCDDGTVRLWDAAGGQALRVLQGHVGSVQSVAWSPDGRQLASAGLDGTLRAWQSNGRELLRMRMTAPDSAQGSAGPTPNTPAPPGAWSWVTLDFRTDPRGRWSGQGPALDAVRYTDPTDTPQPWPWVPRCWRAVDVPELKAEALALEDARAGRITEVEETPHGEASPLQGPQP